MSYEKKVLRNANVKFIIPNESVNTPKKDIPTIKDIIATPVLKPPITQLNHIRPPFASQIMQFATS